MQGILIPISDHPTLPLKRKQEVTCFKPSWTDEVVEVFLKMHHYAKNEDGSYGAEITSKSIQNYESKMVASNSIKMSLDGMELYEDKVVTVEDIVVDVPKQVQVTIDVQVLLPEDQWVDGEPTYTTEQQVVTQTQIVQETRQKTTETKVFRRFDNSQIVNNYIGQFDFFDNIIRNQPILISQMLTSFVVLNDQGKGRWNN